ncbi:MAG: ABC transporter permease [Ignavibacteriales bacterium]|nr:ABC transporter permease [Ignavibacteriales bacterium]
MKNIYHLVIKDIIRFLNDKRAVILTFIVPIILIIIFGNIFGGSGGVRGKADLILVNESNSIVAKLLEAKLDSSKSLQTVKRYKAENGKDTLKFDEKTAKEWVRTGKISAAVIMPKDFFTDTSSAIKIKFYYDPKNEIESNIIQGNMQQTIFTQIPRMMPILMQRKAANYMGNDSTKKFMKGIGNIVHRYFGVSSDSFYNRLTKVDSASLFSSSTDTSTETNFMSNLIKFDSEQLVGKKITNPGLTRAVGGWAMMFLLFSLTGAATSIFEEKNEGTLKRLLCMPITRSDILWSKYIYSMLLGTIQLLVMFVFAWAFFGVEIFANFGNLLILIIASAAAAVSFGMLITSITKTYSQANGISTLLILVMSALGGSWFPTSFLPGWMQVISKGTLTFWSMEGFLQVLWRHSSFAGIATNVLVLLSIAFLINFYALIRFRRGII